MSQRRFSVGDIVKMVRIRNDEDWSKGEQWIEQQTKLVISGEHTYDHTEYTVTEEGEKSYHTVYDEELELYETELDVIKNSSTAF